MRIGNIFTAWVALSAGLASGQNCSPPPCQKGFSGKKIEDDFLNKLSPTCTPSLPEKCIAPNGDVYSEINQAPDNLKELELEIEKQENQTSKLDLERLGHDFINLQLLGVVVPNLFEEN